MGFSSQSSIGASQNVEGCVQHWPLLMMNVEGVKLEAAQCLKLGQTLQDCNFISSSKIFYNHLIFTACASSESSG